MCQGLETWSRVFVKSSPSKKYLKLQYRDDCHSLWVAVCFYTYWHLDSKYSDERLRNEYTIVELSKTFKTIVQGMTAALYGWQSVFQVVFFLTLLKIKPLICFLGLTKDWQRMQAMKNVLIRNICWRKDIFRFWVDLVKDYSKGNIQIPA